ncbi:MAG: DUF4249 family protein [Saprospiraceae bacterium]|nr:DUF4249 family protein [Saprospiraceae bacterium]
MKWIQFVLVFVIGLSSCSEDFQLTEPYKDIPVVYGFLKNFDTAQYIRVERLFVNEDISAIELAKNVDSIYYQNAVVKLNNLTTNKSYTLKKVNMIDEGYARDSGNFATRPNYMYKILTSELNLINNHIFKLTINRGDGKPEVSSTITLLDSTSFSSPPKEDREITLLPNSFSSFAWREIKNAGIYNFELNVLITEKNKVTNTIENKVLNWKLGKDLINRSVGFKNEEFYIFLKENLEKDSKYERILKGVELILLSAGKELKTFNDIRNANTGITASQEIPRYTNLSEGFGLFTNVYQLKKFYTLDLLTLEALTTNEHTSQLGFK